MSRQTIDALNQLLALEYRSLPQYLMDATPWTQMGDEKATSALQSIVTDQQNLSRRIANAVLDRGGTLETGEYPMEFTELNFLAIDFLVKELVHRGKQHVRRIEQLIAQLADDAEARELAQEVLGAEKAHLDMLQELVSQPAA